MHFWDKLFMGKKDKPVTVSPDIQRQLDHCDNVIKGTQERIDDLKKQTTNSNVASHIKALERQIKIVEQKKIELTQNSKQ